MGNQRLTKVQKARSAYLEEDYKVALRYAKDFRINVTDEQRDMMSLGYECIVHPEFYRQLGMNVDVITKNAVQVLRDILQI